MGKMKDIEHEINNTDQFRVHSQGIFLDNKELQHIQKGRFKADKI